MLVYLFEYLDKLDVPGAGMFQFITYRAVVAFILSMFIGTSIGKRIIHYLQWKQVGEIIRDLDLEGQISKKGTPTMGGVIIFLSIVIPTLLFAKLNNIYILLMLIATVWLAGLGFADDYIKVFKKDKQGLKSKVKIVGQVGIGLIVGLVLYLSPDVVIRENTEVLKNDQVESVHFSKDEVKSTKSTIPFFKNNNLDYAAFFDHLGAHRQLAGWILFIFMTIFVVTAVSNGANLTDGLDGLATGTSAIVGVALLILAYVSSNVNFASYLNIMYIPGSEEMVVFMAAFIGATVGFLWYNSYPAQVFMGDTGSLMIGGIIAVFAIIIRKELLIPILCGVFLLENLSVILQRVFFKWTKRSRGVGKRIFKMAPLHHHFQKPGKSGIDALIQWPIQAIPESKIVIRFWIISLLLAAIAIATLKMR
ncbi:MAG: phospho-N-acetylmuramoyl-pentapeptide-transferase [Bacteroidales bacterium]|nr:phospho-N-acetylmuramoyl-pentapeptide-transferase [Bacteroidales bacterium]MDD4770481.1 phospho-N-acetylmuramoyl-pentapeptide-transferase [Bacteroidales bacterium]